MADYLGDSGDNVILADDDDDHIQTYGGADLAAGGDGDDTIEGHSGNDYLVGEGQADSISGGSGDDSIFGDLEPGFESGAYDVDSGVLLNGSPVEASLFGPSVSDAATGHFSGIIGQSTPTNAINVSFVNDISGSMGATFEGVVAVGDLNGDGFFNTRLDAAISSLISLNEAIIDAGFPTAEINIVSFEISAFNLGTFVANQDANVNGILDVVETLMGLQLAGATNYEAALQTAIPFFSGQPLDEANYLYFVSDGEPTAGGVFTDEIATLAGLGVTSTAVGIGAGLPLANLNLISSDGSAVVVVNPESLDAALLGSPVLPTAVTSVQIRVNGVLVQTILSAALVETPFGLTYDVNIPLTLDAADVVTARVLFADGTILENLINVAEPESADDLLDGGSGNDALYGAGGDDDLQGRDGRDDLYAGSGEDKMWGGSGDDSLEGGRGDDLLRGGSGRDTAVYTNSATAVVVDLVDGFGDAGDAGDGRDRLYSIENVDGSAFNDVILGDRRSNVLFGDAGDDTLSGAGGDDTLLGGNGNDILYAGNGTDALSGGAGNDKFFVAGVGDPGKNPSVRVEDSGGIDTIDLTGATGGAVMNLTDGGVVAGRTVEIAAGGTTISPLDVLFLQDLSGSFVDDLPNVEAALPSVITLVQAAQPLTRFGVSSFIDIPTAPFGGPGDYVYRTDLALTSDTSQLQLTYASLISTGGSDLPESQLTALLQAAIRTGEIGWNAAAARVVVLFTDAVFHLAGDNPGTPNDGDAILDGAIEGTGEDYPTIDQVRSALLAAGIVPIFAVTPDVNSSYQSLVSNLGFGGVVDLASDSSNLAAAIAGALDIVTNITEIENLIGTNFADSLTGNDLNNIIDAKDGNDSIFGGIGNDTLLGGDGNDLLNGGAGNDSMVGGLGDDLYVVGAAGDLTVEAAGAGTDLVQSYVATFTLQVNVEDMVLLGSAITGIGNASANKITGSGLNNVLDGAGGDDSLSGGTGNDTLIGGSGNDTLDGGAGNDLMSGGIGNDTFVVAAAGDSVNELLGEGTDLVRSFLGSYTLTANVERLELQGSAVTGIGNALDNSITGNTLSNVLDGSAGNDRLLGGDGSDTLIGGSGSDTLTGGTGPGVDVFAYSSVVDTPTGPGIRDTIMDFDAFDFINLSAIDANSGVAGDQAFSFIGNAAFTIGVAGQLRFSAFGTTAIIDFDVNGDAAADGQILLANYTTVVASDFNL